MHDNERPGPGVALQWWRRETSWSKDMRRRLEKTRLSGTWKTMSVCWCGWNRRQSPFSYNWASFSLVSHPSHHSMCLAGLIIFLDLRCSCDSHLANCIIQILTRETQGQTCRLGRTSETLSWISLKLSNKKNSGLSRKMQIQSAFWVCKSLHLWIQPTTGRKFSKKKKNNTTIKITNF